MIDDLCYPFNQKTFVAHFADTASKIFGDLNLVPTVSRANLTDSFSIWFDENFRWAASMGLKEDADRNSVVLSLSEGDLAVPNHLKKAASLLCALNRTKPILTMNEKNYQDGDFERPNQDDEWVQLALLFPNEFFAIRSAISLVTAENDLVWPSPNHSDFANLVNFDFSKDLTCGYITSWCRTLRLRSPSPASLHQTLRALTVHSHEWSRKQRVQE